MSDEALQSRADAANRLWWILLMSLIMIGIAAVLWISTNRRDDVPVAEAADWLVLALCMAIPSSVLGLVAVSRRRMHKRMAVIDLRGARGATGAGLGGHTSSQGRR
ncbi:MAG: hypothetical protein AB7O92_23480 [Acidimicrobiia bacterium]